MGAGVLDELARGRWPPLGSRRSRRRHRKAPARSRGLEGHARAVGKPSSVRARTTQTKAPPKRGRCCAWKRLLLAARETETGEAKAEQRERGGLRNGSRTQGAVYFGDSIFDAGIECRRGWRDRRIRKIGCARGQVKADRKDPVEDAGAIRRCRGTVCPGFQLPVDGSVVV